MRTIAFRLPYLGLYRVNVEDDIAPAAALESALRQHITPHPYVCPSCNGTGKWWTL